MAPLNEGLIIDIARKYYPQARRSTPLVVLEQIALTVAPRSFVAITGPSGCGKTTLLNIVSGLDRDFEGSVNIGSSAQKIAYVFQTPRLLPWRTVRQNIALVLPAHDPRHAQVDDLIARVGLNAAAADYPERLSLGMQRRVALARAFALAPDILLMDEPFVSLDEATASDLRSLLLDLWARRPTTVLFVTHDKTEAVTLATRVLRLAGSPAKIELDLAVSLARSERADLEAVRAEKRKLFATA
jgi:NitT/TauT family transport system ATP-binding protein